MHRVARDLSTALMPCARKEVSHDLENRVQEKISVKKTHDEKIILVMTKSLKEKIE